MHVGDRRLETFVGVPPEPSTTPATGASEPPTTTPHHTYNGCIINTTTGKQTEQNVELVGAAAAKHTAAHPPSCGILVGIPPMRFDPFEDVNRSGTEFSCILSQVITQNLIDPRIGHTKPAGSASILLSHQRGQHQAMSSNEGIG